MAGLLKRLRPGGAEIVVATTWGPEFTDFLANGPSGGLQPRGPARHAGSQPFLRARAFRTHLHRLAAPAQARAGLGTLLASTAPSAAPPSRGARALYPHHLTHAAYGSGAAPSPTPPASSSTGWARPAPPRFTAIATDDLRSCAPSRPRIDRLPLRPDHGPRGLRPDQGRGMEDHGARALRPDRPGRCSACCAGFSRARAGA